MIGEKIFTHPPPIKNVNYYLTLSIIIVLYYITGKFGLSLAYIHPNVSPVWIPTGISLAAFILLGIKIFPAIFVGSFLVNISSIAFINSISIAFGNTLEGMAGAYLIHKFIKSGEIFNRPVDILKYFIYAGIISTLISATIGGATLFLSQKIVGSDFVSIWLTWWLGDMGGALIVAPLIYLSFTPQNKSYNHPKFLELTAIALLFTVLNFLIFFYNIPYPLAFISVPFLVWIALRSNLRETSAGILILSIIATLGTLNGTGPFIHSDPNQSLLMIQMFIIIVFLIVMPLAASVNQKRELNDRLIKSGLYFDELFKVTSDGVITINENNEIVFTNPAIQRIYAYSPDELIGKKIETLIPDFNNHFVYENYQRENNAGSGWIQKEFSSEDKNGKKIFLELSRGLLKNGDTNTSIFLRDITSRKTFENELLKSKTEIDNFFDNASIGLNWLSSDGIILNANQTELNLLGNKKEDYVGKRFSDFFHYKEDAELFFKEVNKNDHLKNFKTVLTHSDGSLKTVLINARIYRENNDFIYIRCFTRDISEQVKIEETNSFLAAIVESSHDAIIGKSTDYRIISWNRGAQIIYGYTPQEVLGKPVSIIVPEWKKDETRMFNENLLKGFEVNQYETERVKKDGTIINVSLTISPIRDSKGKVIGASAIERDITDKIKSNIQLQNSLKEKELLLKEIHHRVKNNLQIISSLLSLQSQYIEDPDTVEIFNESKNRVRTMALVHEKLYQSEDLLRIDFPAYVSDLTESLTNIYSYKFSGIKIEQEIDNLNISVDDIINLGLIINELITNSFKHGFKEKSKGKITIKFKKDVNCNILEIKDDGKGLPKNFDINNVNSLGLNLVMALSDQLNANLEYHSNGGTEFKLTIPHK